MVTDTAAPAQARFDEAYQTALDRWPAGVRSLRLPTTYGETHVLASGSDEAPSLVFLPGGGATALAWSAVVAELQRSYRCLAVDPIGQAGRSTPGERPIRNRTQLTDWLTQVLDELQTGPVTLVGHSYGAWMSLGTALADPARVERLVLVDPTDCFLPMGLRYRLRAVPLVLRPSAERQRRFLAWETRDRALDPTWLDVVTAGADLGRASVVLPRPFDPTRLGCLEAPTLVVVAGRSRAHHPARLAERANRALPRAGVVTLASATHHTLPTEDAHELSRVIDDFVGGAS
jgi:pimeloyl-ACP methyl ester carboxylesterase